MRPFHHIFTFCTYDPPSHSPPPLQDEDYEGGRPTSRARARRKPAAEFIDDEGEEGDEFEVLDDEEEEDEWEDTEDSD